MPKVCWQRGTRMQDGGVDRRFAPGKPVRVRPALIPTLAVPVNTVTGWAVQNLTCTLDTDAVNVYTKVASPPAANLRMTHTATKTDPTVDYALAPAKDLTNCIIKLALYFPPGAGATDPANCGTIRLFLFSGANYIYWTLARSGSQPSGDARTGWQTYLLSMNKYGAISGAFDPAAVSNVRLNWYVHEDATDLNAVTLGELTFFQKPTTPPMHIMAWDEAVLGTEAAEHHLLDTATYIASKGLRASFYVNKARMIDLAHYQAIRDLGFLVGNHHWTHSNWVTDSWTDEQKVADVVAMADYMTANGLGAGAWHLSQPNGTGQVAQGDPALFPLANSFRLTSGAVGARQDPNEYPLLYAHATGDDVPAARALLTEMALTGLPTCAYFHKGTADLANLQTYIDEVAAARDAGTICVGTPADFY